jgi:hypothetical protein
MSLTQRLLAPQDRHDRQNGRHEALVQGIPISDEHEGGDEDSVTDGANVT